jgi:ATP-dependent DNA helicase RecG
MQINNMDIYIDTFMDNVSMRRISPCNNEDTPQVTPQDTPQVAPEVSPEVRKLILVLEGEKTRMELQHILELKDEKNFRENYQQKAFKIGLIEMTIPDKPNSKNQKYRLTPKGKALKNSLKKNN